MQKPVCNLNFFIGTVHICTMSVDTEKQFAKATHISHEKSVSPILPEKDRSYAGLERRLQIYMQSDKPLPELIDHIDKYGIHVDYHMNLSMTVQY